MNGEDLFGEDGHIMPMSVQKGIGVVSCHLHEFPLREREREGGVRKSNKI